MKHDNITKIVRFRVDILGTSEDVKPLDIPDGSTYYEVDTYKFFILWGGEWLEQNAESEDTEPDDTEPTEPTEPEENNDQR